MLSVLILGSILSRSLPESLFKLSRLYYLDLSGNLLLSIPKSIVQLLGLKYLNIADNHLALFPYFLGNLPSLSVLVCQRNPYRDVSEEVCKLSTEALLSTIRDYVSNHKEEEETPPVLFVFVRHFI